MEKKIKQAIKLIQTTCSGRGTIEVAYSGGKDSDVILELVKMSGIPFRAIYKNTTIDPPGTIAHCKSKGVEIVRPKRTMKDILAKSGMPNRKHRFCCAKLKEYKILDTCIIGVRASESRKREERYKEPTQCRIYSRNEKTHQIMPILFWSDKDVEDFIKLRGIKCHPLYYDEKGKFRVERRLGCAGCCLMSQKKRKEFFLKNNKWLKFYIKNAYNFYESRVKTTKAKLNVYDIMCATLFYKSVDDYLYAQRSIFGKYDPKEKLEKYFNIDLTLYGKEESKLFKINRTATQGESI